MSTARSRRLPISCEACRTRKIRCARDGPPCASCTRRGLRPHECHYVRQPGLSSQPSHRQDAQPLPVSPLSNPPQASASPAPGCETGQDLAQRVQRLEQLLQSQDRTAGNNNTADHVGILASNQSTASSVPRSYQADASRTSTIGSLHVAFSGHVRYVPQPLMWDPKNNLPDDTSSFDTGSSPLGSSVDLSTLLASLPPSGVCTELVHVYFSSFASLFHVLHDPTFSRQYETFLRDAESVGLEWLALLYTILATSVIALSHDHPILAELSRKRTALEKTAELSERWRKMALKCLEADQYLWRHSLTTLQCIILMIYSIGHTHGQTWTLLGLANHLAQSIGCHVDPEPFSITSVEKEERRRCWAALMMLYSNQNTTIGMLGPPRLSHGSGPPADVDDDDIGQPAARHGQRIHATQMTYLLCKFRLYDICAEILEQVLSKPERPSMHTIRALDAAIRDEQSSWTARYSSDDSPLPHHAAHLNVLYSYSDHLTLLLHRRVSQDDWSGDPLQRWSHGRQLECAKRLIRTHSSLEDTPDLAPFRWYNRGLGSFHVFHAAIVLFSLVRVDATVAGSRESYQIFQECLVRLQILSDASVMCAKAASILQRLPNLELNDKVLLENTTSQDAQAQSVLDHRDNWPSDSSPDTLDWNVLSSQFDLQQWLTPTTFPWNQWTAP